MPGPGRGKGRKKSKASSSGTSSLRTTTSRSPYADDVDSADGWTPIVNILCDVFDLPDLTTRRGLKKVHANFDAIYNKLDNAHASNIDNERIKGGIVGIYAKMAVDALLRNKLYQRGFLDKLFPLIQLDSTRYMALRALVTVTHHGGGEIRATIATHSPLLTTLMEIYPDDEDICEMCVTILTHSVGAVTEGPESGSAFPKILKKLDMAKILKCAVTATKKHYSNRGLFEHATELIPCSALHATSAFTAAPEATRYLVAGLRCKDWVTRCFCLGGLIRLHKWNAEDDQRFLDPNKLMMAVTRGVPPQLNDIFMAYGPTRCEIYMNLQATKDFQMAIMTVAQDHNLYALGLKLAKLVLATEFSIADGYYETVNEKTGKREFIDGSTVGLPFTRYSDALTHCAKAIREKGKPEDADAADILDIKFKIMRGKVAEAADHAQRSLERNPQCAYFYYAISLSADHEAGLRASKKGIKCKNITPFIRWQLTQRAVDHAGDFGLNVIQSCQGNQEGKKLEEGIAFLMSAYEDAKAFLAGAPPDNRYMKNVSYWYILLTILLAENLHPDLRELNEARTKLKFADECSKFMGITPPKTMLRLTQETAVKLLPESMQEFEKVFDRASSNIAKTKEKEKTYQDDLAAWLDNLTMEDGEVAMHAEGEFSSHKVNTHNIELYRCSHCGNPSAALRKCSGCAKARYCDSTCQKSHWSEHKKQCRSA